jgi:hypothetical protein
MGKRKQSNYLSILKHLKTTGTLTDDDVDHIERYLKSVFTPSSRYTVISEVVCAYKEDTVTFSRCIDNLEQYALFM